MNTRLFIGATGNVGIGTEAPSSKFEIITADTSGLRHTGSYVTSVFPVIIGITQLETYINNKGGWLRTTTTDALNFAVNNGNPIITLNTNGNVGIGTDSPNNAIKLQVLGKVGIGETVLSDSNRGILDIKASSVDYHSTKLMSDYALTLSHQTVTNGSLGIGFGVSATASITPGASIIFERTASTNVGLLHFCTRSGNGPTSPNVIRMTIQTTGNIGIGTTSPAVALDINNSTSQSNAPFLRLGNSAGGAGNQVGIKLSPWSGRSGGDSSQIIAVDDGGASSHLLFYTAASGATTTSTERMRITNSGNVGIGTNNPGTTLEVRTASSAKGIRHSDGTIQFDTYVGGSVSGGYLQTTSNHPLVLTVNDGTPKLTVNTNGNIGIGTNTPAYQLQLSSDSAAKPSTNTWTVSSDERLKTNIQLADLDICYNVIKNLPLKRYTWKDEVYTIEEVPDRSKLGWIAQDVESVIPKAVEKVSMLGYDDCRTLNSDQIIASLYGCVQKLIKINELQDEEIHNLNEKINQTISENEIKNIEMRQLIERITLLEEKIYNNFTA